MVLRTSLVALGHTQKPLKKYSPIPFFICGYRPHFDDLWLQATLWWSVATGHNVVICGYRPHCSDLWLRATPWWSVASGHTMMICGYRPHCYDLWLQATQCWFVATGHTLMICGYRPHYNDLWLQDTLILLIYDFFVNNVQQTVWSSGTACGPSSKRSRLRTSPHLFFLLFVALGHILFLWLAATSVALGHQTYLWL